MGDYELIRKLIQRLREEDNVATVKGETYRESKVSIAEEVDKANKRIDDLEQRMEVIEYDLEELKYQDKDVVTSMAKLNLHYRMLRRAIMVLAAALVVYAMSQLAALNALDNSHKELESKVGSHISCHEEVVYGQGR